MTDYLLFRLYGPLAAWGDIAVGEQRPSIPHPSKSAVLGLLAAALGIRRHQDEEHQALAEGYGFAVRVDAPGIALRDYHTTQIPNAIARLKHLCTRRDETLDRGNLYTILSSRDYRCDALYTVCLWPRGERAPYPLQVLADALRTPRLPLYLGRKSCPLALPLAPACLNAETLDRALRAFDNQIPEDQRGFLRKTGLDRLPTGSDCYWEDDAAISPDAVEYLHSTPRHDLPLSRRRWQFAPRDEHYGRIKGG
jgi:CRISPR system Cascade subunit CasD